MIDTIKTFDEDESTQIIDEDKSTQIIDLVLAYIADHEPEDLYFCTEILFFDKFSEHTRRSIVSLRRHFSEESEDALKKQFEMLMIVLQNLSEHECRRRLEWLRTELNSEMPYGSNFCRALLLLHFPNSRFCRSALSKLSVSGYYSLFKAEDSWDSALFKISCPNTPNPGYGELQHLACVMGFSSSFVESHAPELKHYLEAQLTTVVSHEVLESLTTLQAKVLYTLTNFDIWTISGLSEEECSQLLKSPEYADQLALTFKFPKQSRVLKSLSNEMCKFLREVLCNLPDEQKNRFWDDLSKRFSELESYLKAQPKTAISHKAIENLTASQAEVLANFDMWTADGLSEGECSRLLELKNTNRIDRLILTFKFPEKKHLLRSLSNEMCKFLRKILCNLPDEQKNRFLDDLSKGFSVHKALLSTKFPECSGYIRNLSGKVSEEIWNLTRRFTSIDESYEEKGVDFQVEQLFVLLKMIEGLDDTAAILKIEKISFEMTAKNQSFPRAAFQVQFPRVQQNHYNLQLDPSTCLSVLKKTLQEGGYWFTKLLEERTGVLINHLPSFLKEEELERYCIALIKGFSLDFIRQERLTKSHFEACMKGISSEQLMLCSENQAKVLGKFPWLSAQEVQGFSDDRCKWALDMNLDGFDNRNKDQLLLSIQLKKPGYIFQRLSDEEAFLTRKMIDKFDQNQLTKFLGFLSRNVNASRKPDPYKCLSLTLWPQSADKIGRFNEDQCLSLILLEERVSEDTIEGIANIPLSVWRDIKDHIKSLKNFEFKIFLNRIKDLTEHSQGLIVYFYEDAFQVFVNCLIEVKGGRFAYSIDRAFILARFHHSLIQDVEDDPIEERPEDKQIYDHCVGCIKHLSEYICEKIHILHDRHFSKMIEEFSEGLSFYQALFRYSFPSAPTFKKAKSLSSEKIKSTMDNLDSLTQKEIYGILDAMDMEDFSMWKIHSNHDDSDSDDSDDMDDDFSINMDLNEH